MGVQCEVTADTLKAFLTGEIDHHTAANIRAAVDDIAESGGIRLLQMDFSGVSFMDSSGVGLVMGRYRLMKLLGGELELTGLSERMETILRLAGLDKLGLLKRKDEKPA